MARIPQEVIDNIRNHVDIVDVISHYVPLTRKGKSYKCVCPFHDDHDPSLSISQEKQIYHCFVCGAGGNVFNFVQRYENISYVEAILKVANLAGIEVDFDVSSLAQNKPKDPHVDALHKVMQASIDYCAYELKSVEAKEVLKYLHNRGLSDEIIEKFALGYHPGDNKLYRFLHAKKFKDEDMIDANLARITSSGIRDVFYNRIVIPIHDAQGNPVGFSARRIVEDDSAKYINTAETDIYVKGNLLYNYHRARESARRVGSIIVVEGAMDVLAFEKAGISNCVATLGTAVTNEQLKLLRYLGVPIRLCYDGDKAGLNATYKFYKLAQQMGLHVEILHNKYDLDPDEIIETYGKEELIALSKRTQSWIEFLIVYLQRRYDLENYNEKKEYAQMVGSEIAKLKDEFEKKNYYVRLQQITGFDMQLQETPVEAHQPKQIYKPTGSFIRQPIEKKRNAQMQILSQLLLSKSASEYYRNELGFLPDEDCNTLALYIIDFYRHNDTIEVADLLNHIKEEAIRKIAIMVSDWELANHEYSLVILKDAIAKVKESMIDDKIKLLMKESDQMNDPIEKAKIAQEIITLQRKRGGAENGKEN